MDEPEFSKNLTTDEHGWTLMKAELSVDLKHTEISKLLLKDETQQIIGCAFEVLNEVGHGFHEKAYENALVVEFKLRAIPFDQQKHFPINHKSVQVAEYVPDLIAFGAVIVDAKTIERITDLERGKMINYLRVAKLRVGLILNFKNPRLEWERVVL